MHPQPPIRFYQTRQPYDALSNVSPVPIQARINGQTLNLASTEHLYQALKGMGSADPQVQAQVAPLLDGSIRPGRGVQEHGKRWIRNRLFITAANQRVEQQFKYQLMVDILMMKATQNPELLRALLLTGEAEIQEDAGMNDLFWGIGDANHPGENALGKAWMQVRHTLRQELQAQGQVQVRTGISAGIAHALGVTSEQFGPQVITQAQLDATPPQHNTADHQFSASGLQAQPQPQPNPDPNLQPAPTRTPPGTQRLSSNIASVSLAAPLPKLNDQQCELLEQHYTAKGWEFTKHPNPDKPEGPEYQVKLPTGGQFLQSASKASTTSSEPREVEAMVDAFIKGLPADNTNRRIRIRHSSNDPTILEAMFDKVEALGYTVTNYERDPTTNKLVSKNGDTPQPEPVPEPEPPSPH